MNITRRNWILTASAAAGYLALPRRVTARDAKAEKQLKVHSESPLNGEPDLAELVKSHVTPLSHFYVRNHGPIPEVNAKSHRLTIEGLVHKPRTISLDELQDKLKDRKTEAT